MGSPLIKKLDALYQRAQMVMKVQADHAPFVSIAPWSFIKDECIVKYYPEGHYQKPEQIRQRRIRFRNLLSMQRDRAAAMQKCFT